MSEVGLNCLIIGPTQRSPDSELQKFQTLDKTVHYSNQSQSQTDRRSRTNLRHVLRHRWRCFRFILARDITY